MNHIKLYFTDFLSKWQIDSKNMHPELVAIDFLRHEETKVLHSVRGKLYGHSEDSRVFQWTPAVKALAILLLSARIDGSFDDNIGKGELIGGKGSLASTLDYAISKQPAWITDVFGTYNGGNCYLRKLY